ncbi:MAG TPA: deoxyhypusine synthase [Candidatus Nanoarchaeia archaeon]|nr:deoxyhypusine synthase [Candidatus Nanoarchaeia archaeon]
MEKTTEKENRPNSAELKEESEKTRPSDAELKEETARKNLFREGEEISGVVIKGYDFSKGVDYNEIVKGFSTSGFQASNLAKAIEIINNMIEDGAIIYLGYTSNMVSSGIRETIKFLIQNKKVDICVTTGGGVEEDIIKCLGDFILGDFGAKGSELRNRAINRIGNIFVPNSRYVKFEQFVMPVLEELYQEQKKRGKPLLTYDIVWKLGEKINDERSICYWAWKNKIKIYCPTVMDGSLGDMIYLFKHKREDFIIDISEDTKEFNNSTIGLLKSGVIILGTGVVKHSILNANMYRNGADYAVYINNAHEFDGSDSGALPEEAVSWGKLAPESQRVKVFGDATILFPIVVAETFAKK